MSHLEKYIQKVWRMKWIALFLSLFLFSSCSTKSPEEASTPFCSVQPKLRLLSQNEMTAAFRNDIIEKLASSSQTDLNGALDRNKTAYFHVRFQMGISPLADYAVDAQNSTALEMAIRAIEYSFRYQKPNGDFQLVVPADLAATTNVTEGDKVSGIAFFCSSLGSGLMALQDNSGYQAQTAARKRVEVLIPQYQLSLNFLKDNAGLLKQIDATAPNRLFFDALAFFSMGKYLSDSEAMKIGNDFVTLAMVKKMPEGYFLEGSGYDSSYQGVGLAIGFKLLSLMKDDNPLRQSLYETLACATHWEATRVKPSGEVSTEGNSRVYSGGETFLGQEKGMAYTSILKAFWNMYYLTGNEEYNTLANKVLAYYVP